MQVLTRNLLFFAAAAIVVRAAFYSISGFIADDAFITFRYVENIANGLGFVYNAGQHVLGTSSPLYTLLLTIPALLGLDVPNASIAISIIASGITAILIYRLTLLYGFKRFAWMPVVFYILWPRSVVAETCGMETSLFTLLAIGSFYAYRVRRPQLTLLLAAFAAICRPEGMLIGIVVLPGLIQEWKWGLSRYLILPALILAAWGGFSLSYFGTIIPNSIPAKLALYGQIDGDGFFARLEVLLALYSPFGWLAALLAAAGIAVAVKDDCLPRPETSWLALMLAFFMLSGTHIFFWYFVPVYPVFLFLVFVSVRKIVESIAVLRTPSYLAGLVTGIATTAVLTFALALSADSYALEQNWMEHLHKNVGLYLAEHVSAGEVVAAEDIGYMGYYSRSTILDRDGLVSPEAIPYNRSGDYLQLIRDLRPDWVVANSKSPISQFIYDIDFDELYELRERFRARPFEYRVYHLVSDSL